MSLLNEILNRPLDAGYLEARTEMERHRHARRSVWGQAGIFVIAVALAIVTVWGVRQLRLPEAAAARQGLEKEAVTRSGEVEARRKAVSGLQAQLAQLRAAELPGLALAESTLNAAATTPVHGPGLVITLDDAPAVKNDPGNAGTDLRVHDSDVQSVVNGLWGAGAEAIAVNGHRLTALSTIRAAGSAIQVDLVSLIPPYEIQAIGPARQLQANLGRTPAKARLALLSGTYGIPVQYRTEKDMRLPAAAVTQLRYATPAPG